MAAVNNSAVSLPNIDPNHIVMIVARKNSGKTFLIKHLLRDAFSKGLYDWCVCITPTKFNKDYTNILGDKYVFESFDPEQIDAMLNTQESMIKKRKKHLQGLLILDDCLGSVDFTHRVFTKLFSTNRHFKIGVWVTSQKYKALPPICRGNADKTILLNTVNDTVAKSLHEEYCTPRFPTFRDLQRFCHECNQNYGGVCISNGKTAEYSCIRAPSSPLKKFTIKMKK
jgi:hypothetical protein